MHLRGLKIVLTGKFDKLSRKEAQARLEAQREAWLRALADAENARKRAQADISQARKYAAERTVEDLLPVMDSLEAALGAGGAEAEALRVGQCGAHVRAHPLAGDHGTLPRIRHPVVVSPPTARRRSAGSDPHPPSARTRPSPR